MDQEIRIQSHVPVIRAAAEDALPQGRPAHMEHLGRVPAEHLQRLVRAGGRVVDADAAVFTASG